MPSTLLMRRRLFIATGVLILLAVALVSIALYGGADTLNGTSPSPSTIRVSGGTTSTTGPDGLEKIVKYNPGDQVSRGYVAYDGPTSLEERMVRSDVIARVKLVSVAQVVEEAADWPNEGETSYIGALEYTFKVLEYLKGSGGSELVAVAVDLIDNYATEAEAAAGAEDFLGARDARWDDREAVVFLEDDDPHLPSSKQADRYLLGFVRNNYGGDHYTIASRYSREWLPAASTGSALDAAASSWSSGGERFCLAGPCDGGGVVSSLVRVLTLSQAPDTPTVTLAELKTRIAELDAEIEAGDGSQEYMDCVYAKYEKQGRVDYYKQQLADKSDEPWVKDGYFYRRRDHALTSGQAAGTHIYTDTIFWAGTEPPPKETIPDKYTGMFQLDGRDSHLFDIEYPGVVSLARPLPAGEYRYYFVSMPKKYVVCNGEPEEERRRHEHFVTLTAPAGTLHEAFFDPVSMGASVVADDHRGQLSPATYSAAGSETTLRRIGWDENRVWMKFVLAPSLADHHIDFIELDGSVGLRLDFDDATATSTDDGGQALVWGVCDQPWSAGDQLMLRISESGETLTGATNDATCGGEIVSLAVPLQTAVFSPTSDVSITPPLAPSGCGTAGLWDCLDEAEPDGAGSIIYLFTNSALRVGFPAASVSGTPMDVRFEVALKAQSGTVDAGAYDFTVYSDKTAVATLSGDEELGSEAWTELVVSDQAITSGLSSGLSGVAFQVDAPSSGPRLEWSWVRMVVDYRPTGQ